MGKCMNECICCSNLVRNVLTGQRTMFNYGSREIIKLVIQALHQRFRKRSRVLISEHVFAEENIVQMYFKLTQFIMIHNEK